MTAQTAKLFPPHFAAAQLIAELGTSHSGSLQHARKLVAAAANAGAQTVKFQWVIAAEILHPRTGQVPLPGGPRDLYSVFENLERSSDFYCELKQICDEQGVHFLCTPFGAKSAEELFRLGVSQIKVASPELNHIPLLRQLAGFGLDTILSTGVSKLADIEEAIAQFPDSSRLSLLHCVTSYPAPEEEYNLLLIPLLAKLFGVRVGVSDHSIDPLLIPLVSALCGGQIVEKHLTLSRQSGGLDDPIAITPSELEALRSRMDALEGLPTEQAWEELAAQFGQDRIRACLGSGQKVLAASEAANYGRTNRSIHISRDLRAGHILQPSDLAVLRTEKELSPGLHPRYLDMLPGKRLAADLEDGAGIRWEHLLHS